MKGQPTSGPDVRKRSEAARVPVFDHELVHCIGCGSYGEVWLARNRLGTMRAVKIVRRASFDEDRPYEREFAGIRKFEPIARSHEGFVDLLQVGRNDAEGYFYYVMELADPLKPREVRSAAADSAPSDLTTSSPPYEPHTLASAVRSDGALPVDECLRIARALTSALVELHRHGLVHRDIKPSNIIFVQGTPKLADIGLVAGTNEPCSLVGTEGFIPPEGPGTPQADLYSLGIVLYAISTGKSHHDFPEPPSDLATRLDRKVWLELQAIVHRACQADPRRRYTDAAGMLEDLELLEAGKSVKSKHRRERRWEACRRVGTVAVLVALLCGGMDMLRRPPTQNRPLSPDPQAVIRYEQARGLLNQEDRRSRRLAYSALTEAVNRDPKLLAAYYLMFECNFWDDQLPPHSNAVANLQWVTERMKVLDPDSAEYHTAAAWLKFLEWKWDEEIEHLRLALRANPRFLRAHGLYAGVLLRARGDPESARREFELAEQCDGFDTIIQSHLGTPDYVLGNYTDAIAQFRKAISFQHGAEVAWLYLGFAHEANGQYRAALDAFEQLEKAESDADTLELGSRYGLWRAILADKGPRALWQAMLEHHQRSSPDSYTMAGLHARLGNTNDALALIEKAFQEHNPSMPRLLMDHYWRPLREEPRFQAIVKQMGFRVNR